MQYAMLIYIVISNMIVMTGGNAYGFSTKNQTEKNQKIRLYASPVELIDRIDKAIVNQDVTFSSFVIQACEYALNDMDTSKNQ